MSKLKTLVIGFRSTRSLREDEIDLDEDVDDIADDFDFSDNGMYDIMFRVWLENKLLDEYFYRIGVHAAFEENGWDGNNLHRTGSSCQDQTTLVLELATG